MKRILVPVDFSPYSDKALQLAVLLARRTGAKLRLVHCVYTPLEWNNLTVRQQEQYPETVARTVDAEIALSALAETRQLQRVDLEFRVVHGTPYRQITNQATLFKADLIVMGTHGNENNDRPFIGSNSQRVMRLALCPVMSVKPDARVKTWKKVVFAADFEANPSHAFERLLPLIDDLGSRVHLLFVNTPGRFRTTLQAEAHMQTFARKFPNLAFTFEVFNHLDIQSGVIDFLKKAGVDCLIMATHNREHAPVYQLGQTEAVLFHTNIPVISLR